MSCDWRKTGTRHTNCVFYSFHPGGLGVKFDSPQKKKSFSDPDLFHGDGGVYLYSKVLLLLLQTLSDTDAHFM